MQMVHVDMLTEGLSMENCLSWECITISNGFTEEWFWIDKSGGVDSGASATCLIYV